MASPMKHPCAGSVRLFYSDLFVEQEAAKAICRTCPFRAPCLQKAFDLRAPGGIWGGFDEVERSFFQKLYGNDVGDIVRELPVSLVDRLRRNRVMQQGDPPDVAMEA